METFYHEAEKVTDLVLRVSLLNLCRNTVLNDRLTYFGHLDYIINSLLSEFMFSFSLQNSK